MDNGFNRVDAKKDLAGDATAFAEGEAFGEDPLRARMVEEGELEDDFGVMRSFGA